MTKCSKDGETPFLNSLAPGSNHKSVKTDRKKKRQRETRAARLDVVVC